MESTLANRIMTEATKYMISHRSPTFSRDGDIEKRVSLFYITVSLT